MDTADVITRVQRLFGDESAVQVTEADIIRWINDAQRDIVLKNETLLESSSLVSIVAGQQEYSYPTDLMVLRSIRIKYNDALSYQHINYYTLQEFDRRVVGWDGTFHGTGIPFIYTTYDRQIFLFPSPDKNVTDGIKILYSKLPTDVVLSTDSLSLPIMYHNAIVDYCVSKANTLDEDYEAAAIHDAKYTAAVDRLSFRHKMGARETYPTITTLEEDLD